MSAKTDGLDAAVSTVPVALAVWIQERGFDVCPWEQAPVAETRKIVGQDAWRFGRVVLVRVPISTTGPRFYVTICQGHRPGQAVGYWLEVRPLPLRQTGTDDS